jgi:hypothetical protein
MALCWFEKGRCEHCDKTGKVLYIPIQGIRICSVACRHAMEHLRFIGKVPRKMES